MRNALRYIFLGVVVPIAGVYVMMTYVKYFSNDFMLTAIGVLMGYPAYIIFVLANNMAYGEEPKSLKEHLEESVKSRGATTLMTLLLGLNTNYILFSNEPIISIASSIITFGTILLALGLMNRIIKKNVDM